MAKPIYADDSPKGFQAGPALWYGPELTRITGYTVESPRQRCQARRCQA